MLHGRQIERARLAELIDRATSSRGGALVVRGDPGVGKTALLTDAAHRSAGLTVLWTQGIESESPLPFAALQRLLRPVMEHLAHIPALQADALRRAFGEYEATQADRFVAFVGTLSLLADAAESRPVLCVVDDAHWLDAASAEALLFVARRLEADRIALLFGAREGDLRRFDAPGVPDLTLAGLEAEAASALLSERSGVAVSDVVRDELMARTGGNPLALVELPAVLSGEHLAGAVGLPSQLPLTQGVERAFLDRCRRLPADSQTWLLIAAADDSGRIGVIQRAAHVLGVDATAGEDAERSGLVSVTGHDLALRHPLVRSAVYAAATSADRQRVHRALAEALTDSGDTDRRTWHLSLATDDVDETLAAALDVVARNAERRGGHEAAGAAAERAADLTTEPDARARRLFAAAFSAWKAGDTARARARADRAVRHAIDPRLRADIERLRGRLEWNVGSLEVGQRIVMDAAVEVAPSDIERAVEMAMLATTLAGFGPGAGLAAQPAFRPELPADASPRLRCFAALLEGQQQLQAGALAEAATSLRGAIRRGDDLPPDADLLSNMGIAAFHLGDDEAGERNYARLLAWARAQGAAATMAFALSRLPFAQLPAGRWAPAGAAAHEAAELARGIGQPSLTALPLAWLAILAALRGDAAAATHLDELERVQGTYALGVVTGVVADLVAWTRGALSAQSHDAAAALHHLSRIGHPILQRLAALDRVEAAVRADATGLAQQWSDDLLEFGTAVGSGWACAAGHHGRALAGGRDDPEESFLAALAFGDDARPIDRARTQLAYGEWLRRRGRRVDARTHLRAALEAFDDVGAGPWAERAREELRASGVTARKRDVSTVDNLTPQELQTARLVKQGLSNREVAERMYVSPRTVEYHLSHAYQKLGVRSRVELAQLPLS